MKLLVRSVFVAITLLLIFYVSRPSADFPPPPSGAKQSMEPADTETPLRRAYFTDFTREEIIAHYQKEFIGFPTLRLNYPPEDAQTIIRDQTRSYYLEELAHPLRESLYINGFVPQHKKDAILIDGVEYYQKITIKYVPSSSAARIVYVLAFSGLTYFVFNELTKLLTSFVKFIFSFFR